MGVAVGRGEQEFAGGPQAPVADMRLHGPAGERLPPPDKMRAAEAAGAGDARDGQGLGGVAVDELAGEADQRIGLAGLTLAAHGQLGDHGPAERIALGHGRGALAKRGDDQLPQQAYRAHPIGDHQRPAGPLLGVDLHAQPIAVGPRSELLMMFAADRVPQHLAEAGLGAPGVHPSAVHETTNRHGHVDCESIFPGNSESTPGHRAAPCALAKRLPAMQVRAMPTPLRRIAFNHGDLRVSADRRSLSFADGTPFF